LFNIVLGLGSAVGAVLAAAGPRPRTRAIVITAALFGILQAVAALAPNLAIFLTLLIGMGFVNLICQAMANASVQLAVEPELRGRVMGLYMLVFIGGTPIGAPTIGAVTSHFGARTGMLVCGLIPALAAVIVALAVARGSRQRKRKQALPPSWELLESVDWGTSVGSSAREALPAADLPATGTRLPRALRW
jgi:MFS family permease